VHVPRLRLSLDPLLAEANRRMRRRRVLTAALLVLPAAMAATALIVSGAGGPPSGGPGGVRPPGTSGQAIEHAFAGRGIAVAPAAAMPELCHPSACTGLVLWGGAEPVYLVPRHGRDFALVVFRTAASAHRVAAFERAHAPTLATYVRGPAVLVYLRSSSRIARLRTALAAAR
jgi:hypothetical protein